MTNRIDVYARALLFTAVITVCVFIESAWAGDTGLFSRQTYDLVMRWVNFLILAAVAIKYGRKPILHFLDNQRKNVARSIEALEDQKKQAEAQVRESQRQLDDNQDRLIRIKERIIAEGQSNRDQMIADARNDARSMMDSTKSKIEGQMRTAYDGIKAELIDMAADLALTKLPAIISRDDQDQWVHRWFDSTEEKSLAPK